MKRGGLLWYTAILAIVAAPALVAQQQATTQFQSQVIETFDDPENSPWVVRGGRFVDEENGYPRFQFVNTWPQALYRNEPDGRSLLALGAQGAFVRQGYNFLEVIPIAPGGETDENGEPVLREIPLNGRVSNLDVWVWGSNFDYYLDAHIRDYRGMTHVLPLGGLNYRGWRNLRVSIPTGIPQDTRYVATIEQDGALASDLRSLSLVKLVLWTRPGERVDGFYVYLDELKIETDVYREPFDGEDLRDPSFVQELWTGATEG